MPTSEYCHPKGRSASKKRLQRPLLAPPCRSRCILGRSFAVTCTGPARWSHQAASLTRERNRERGYIFAPCSRLRDVLWYTLGWLDETATDGDPGRLGALLGAE